MDSQGKVFLEGTKVGPHGMFVQVNGSEVGGLFCQIKDEFEEGSGNYLTLGLSNTDDESIERFIGSIREAVKTARDSVA